MNPVTITAAVLSLWTFQPFDTIQKAHAFMDTLSPSSQAQLSYGVVETAKEEAARAAARKTASQRYQASIDRDAARCALCQKEEKLYSDKFDSNTKVKDLPELKSNGMWIQDTKGGILEDPKWVIHCPMFTPNSVFIDDTYGPGHRWVVSYRRAPEAVGSPQPRTGTPDTTKSALDIDMWGLHDAGGRPRLPFDPDDFVDYENCRKAAIADGTWLRGSHCRDLIP
jgi:hypothetical protein